MYQIWDMLNSPIICVIMMMIMLPLVYNYQYPGSSSFRFSLNSKLKCFLNSVEKLKKSEESYFSQSKYHGIQ